LRRGRCQCGRDENRDRIHESLGVNATPSSLEHSHPPHLAYARRLTSSFHQCIRRSAAWASSVSAAPLLRPRQFAQQRRGLRRAEVFDEAIPRSATDTKRATDGVLRPCPAPLQPVRRVPRGAVFSDHFSQFNCLCVGDLASSANALSRNGKALVFQVRCHASGSGSSGFQGWLLKCHGIVVRREQLATSW